MTHGPGRRWDTRDIPRAQQFDAWQAMLQSVYGTWDVARPAKPDFDAHIHHHAVGGFQIVDCVCDPCAAKRMGSEIRRDGREALTIQLVLSGFETFAIEDRRISLGAGDVLIWNSIRPMSFEVTERLRKISVTVPLARLRSWLPTRWHSIATNLPQVSPGAGLLSSVIGAVSPHFLAGALRDGEALTESVISLLVNAIGCDRGDDALTRRGAQLLIVKDYIHAHLSDPDLSPSALASANRISLRYLHALFEAEGTTVQQYIIRERVLRCRRELENPKMAGRTITDIAFGWGFQNSTHFGRRFKAEMGISPQDFRADVLVAARRQPAGAEASSAPESPNRRR